MAITVRYTNQTRNKINPDRYTEVIHQFLPKYGITDSVEIELRIVGQQTMRQLNRQHRHKDYPTDVLSFPIWPNLDTIKKQAGQILLGSIVLCWSVINRDAKKEARPLEDHVSFLIAHSLLHLIGIHHDEND